MVEIKVQYNQIDTVIYIFNRFLLHRNQKEIIINSLFDGLYAFIKAESFNSLDSIRLKAYATNKVPFFLILIKKVKYASIIKQYCR